jgi:hypothetical protein
MTPTCPSSMGWPDALVLITVMVCVFGCLGFIAWLKLRNSGE